MKIILAILLLIPSLSQANVLFEGWFEVFLGSKKVGYMVERFEFVNNKFKVVSYLKTNADGNNITESIKGFSAADLKPLNYSYTSVTGKDGKDIKVIDATYTGEKCTLKINDGKGTKKETKVIKKGTFLASFLLYMIMNQKDGLSEGKSYNYYAVAEEDGKVYMGTAKISTLDTVKGKKAFKILNKFKDSSYFSWVTPKGEFLLTRNPENNIDVRFAENQKQAVGDLGVDLKSLKLLFDTLPGDSPSKLKVEPSPAPSP